LRTLEGENPDFTSKEDYLYNFEGSRVTGAVARVIGDSLR